MRLDIAQTRRALPWIVIASLSFGIGWSGCAEDPAASRATGTVQLAIHASDGPQANTQFQLPAGDYTVEGEATPTFAPDAATAGPPSLDTVVTVLDADGNLVVSHTLTIPAPEGVTDDDVWIGEVPIHVEKDDVLSATLWLGRDGDTPDSHLGLGIGLQDAPSISMASLSPTRLLPGEAGVATVDVTDPDGDPAALEVFVTVGGVAFPLDVVAELDGVVTMSGEFVLPNTPGAYEAEILALDEDGLSTTDTKRVVTRETDCVPGEGTVFVADTACLAQLGLQGSNPYAEEYTELLLSAVVEGLPSNTYRFVFSPLVDPVMPAVTDATGELVLDYVARESMLPDTACTSVERIDADEILLGDSNDSMTRGVCGAIATVHSLNKLGLTIPTLGTELYGDGFISGSYIQGIMGGRALLPIGRLIDAHVAGLKTQFPKAKRRDLCQETTGSGQTQAVTNNRKGFTPTSNEGNMGQFVSYLQSAMQAGKDVTLIVDTARGVAHAEHIVSVTVDADGVATVETANGYEQGNLTTEVPADAGTNTWTVDPAGGVTLTSSTADDAAGYQLMIAEQGGVTSVKFVSCGAP